MNYLCPNKYVFISFYGVCLCIHKYINKGSGFESIIIKIFIHFFFQEIFLSTEFSYH